MKRIAKLTAIATALVFAGPASALPIKEMPDPTAHKIKVPTSIGGVSFGMSLEAANKAWGGEGQCGTKVLPDSCFWGDFYEARDGRAEIEAAEGEVDFIQISWSGYPRKGDPVIRKELTRRFHTPEGLTLGSKLGKVGDTYPDAKPIRRHGDVRGWVITEDDSRMYIGGNDVVFYISILAD